MASDMAMPKTTVNKQRDAKTWKYEIWRTGQVASLEPKAETKLVRSGSNGQLRGGV
jgi:hypothetical protein